jgi:hypothetical protein
MSGWGGIRFQVHIFKMISSLRSGEILKNIFFTRKFVKGEGPKIQKIRNSMNISEICISLSFKNLVEIDHYSNGHV